MKTLKKIILFKKISNNKKLINKFRKKQAKFLSQIIQKKNIKTSILIFSRQHKI